MINSMKKNLFSLAILVLSITISSKTFAQEAPGGSGDGSGSIDAGTAAGPSTAIQPSAVQFFRNNGDGTCGGSAQIRLYYTTVPTIAPTLDNIIYNGQPLIANFTPVRSILGDITTKGYFSFCLPASNIPPVIKLVIQYHYEGTAQSFELSGNY